MESNETDRDENPLESASDASDGNGRLGSDGMTYPIGFFNFSYNSVNSNGVGAMLVTDNTGIPLEFVVTTAVRPTQAQRLLYGRRLRSFIAINLCAKQLLQDVKTKPKVLFVYEDWLLPIFKFTDIPVMQLVPAEQLGTEAVRPTIVPPEDHPEFTEIIDLTSLDPDMIDAFDRIEKCREALCAKSEDYKL